MLAPTPFREPYDYAFGDESGQAGFKFERGSTEWFVFTVLLTNQSAGLRTYTAEFRARAGLHATAELKFHSTPDQLRSQYLTGLLRYDIAIRAVFVHKPALPIEFSQMKSWDFYAFFVGNLLGRLPVGELGNTKLVLDEYGPVEVTARAVRRRMRKLWPESRHSLIRRVGFKRSSAHDGLQATDMVGGAIYRWLAENDRRFLTIIQPKTVLWEYRP
ncbi:MAG: DUF3800 domain-containing protein [Chloroflexi bacterium]|nr:DUF3800 domain-containing protein [Chloroflexota bacterium]